MGNEFILIGLQWKWPYSFIFFIFALIILNNLILMGARVNFLGLISFPISTVFSVVLLVSWFRIISLVLNSFYGRCVSFLSHFSPSRVQRELRDNPNTSLEILAMRRNLSWLICILELVRMIIRPCSLSLRLVANISCGHILLTLLGKPVSGNFSTISYEIVIFFICRLETLVCLVQSYVFVTLWNMYQSE